MADKIQLSAEKSRKLVRRGQSHTGSRHALGGAGAEKAAEQFVLFLIGHANPPILDGKTDLSVFSAYAYGYRLGFRGVFDGVGNEIGKDLFSENRICRERRRNLVTNADADRTVGRFCQLAGFRLLNKAFDLAARGRCRDLTGFKPDDIERGVEEGGQSSDLGADLARPLVDFGAGHGLAAAQHALHC